MKVRITGTAEDRAQLIQALRNEGYQFQDPEKVLRNQGGTIMGIRRNLARKAGIGQDEVISVYSRDGKVLLKRGATRANELPPDAARQLAAILITAAEMADQAIDWE